MQSLNLKNFKKIKWLVLYFEDRLDENFFEILGLFENESQAIKCATEFLPKIYGDYEDEGHILVAKLSNFRELGLKINLLT